VSDFYLIWCPRSELFSYRGVGRVVFRYRKQSNFEDSALEWLDEQHRDEVQRGLAQE
jgi:hypothetical protein